MIWVRQIRDLAYDVEDCIEFVVHLDKKSSWWWRLVPSWCMVGRLPLDEAVDQIQELKARVEDVSTRNTRYSLISDTGSKPMIVQQQPVDSLGPRAFNMLVAPTETGKRQQGDLTHLLTKSARDLQVISVCGTGGDLGIASIIWKAYNDQKIRQNFNCRAWVKIRHPFNPQEFIRCLIDEFHASSSSQEPQGPISAAYVQKRMEVNQGDHHDFVQQVNTKRYLVVLEGLSTMAEWGAIRTFFPNIQNRSRIILTTQQFEVATLSVGNSYQVWDLHQFSAEHSVYAFFQEGSQGDDMGDVADNGSSINDETKWKTILESKKANAATLVERPVPVKELTTTLSESAATENGSTSTIIESAAPDIGSAVLEKESTPTLIETASSQEIEAADSENESTHTFTNIVAPGIESAVPENESTHTIIESAAPEIESPAPEIETAVTEKESTPTFIDTAAPGIESVIPENESTHTITESTAPEIETPDSEIESAVPEKESTPTFIDGAAPGIESAVPDKDSTPTLIESAVSEIESAVPEKESTPTLIESSVPKKELTPTVTKSAVPEIKGAASEKKLTPPFIGRDLEMIELRQYLIRSRNKVMSVWGIAGVGKSALIRNLFCDRILYSQANIFNKYGWVDVTHPLNLRDFFRSLLWNIHSKSIDTTENEYHFMMRNKNPIQECQELLKAGQCLIVIDDVQSKKEWDLIQEYLVPRSSNNVILVITTEASIATYCADKEDLVFNVKSLKVNAASTLFKKVSKRTSFPIGREAELQELTWKCGGLPKIIVSVGSLLSTKTVTWMQTACSINLSFIEELETNRSCDSLRDLFSWMGSYFRLCPDFLKPCIFYLSLFPRYHSIRRRRLVRRWIAEGYARDSEDKSAKQNGEAFFNNLLSLSIIQQPPEKAVTTALGQTRMVWCQVNGFIREYIVSRRMDENLVFELEGNCIPTTQRTGRHLVIGESWDRDKIVFKSIDVSRLRSVTVFGDWRPFLVSESMTLLRVLDLEDAVGVMDEDVEKIVRWMRSLKFLSLRGCHEVSYLPCSLGDLRQLQSLDVRGTSIDTLPESITELEQLQYIRAGATAPASTLYNSACSRLSELCCRRRKLEGVRVPGGVRKLKALRTIGVINVSASWSKAAMVKELKKVTQLCKLGVSGINSKNSDKFLTAIKGNVHLESLSVRLDKGSQACLEGKSQLLELKNLQSLKLYGIKDKLPILSVQLSKIAKLVLEMDVLTKDVITFLGKLPKLSILRLRVNKLESDKDGKIPFLLVSNSYENTSYENVKILYIACSSKLPVTFGTGTKTMQNLELLKIDCCSGSEYEFSGLDHLSELKEVLIVKGSNHDTLKQNIESKLANHPKRPDVKLEEPRYT